MLGDADGRGRLRSSSRHSSSRRTHHYPTAPRRSCQGLICLVTRRPLVVHGSLRDARPLRKCWTREEPAAHRACLQRTDERGETLLDQASMNSACTARPPGSPVASSRSMQAHATAKQRTHVPYRYSNSSSHVLICPSTHHESGEQALLDLPISQSCASQHNV